MKIREIPLTAIDFIKLEEGIVLHKYKDIAGYETIGIGHFIKKGEVFPETITIDVADKLLLSDLRIYASSIMRLINVPLSDNQYSSLLSFTFNLGSGALQASTLRSKLNRKDYIGAGDEFPKWCCAGGRKIRGLLLRRYRERCLFLTQ